MKNRKQLFIVIGLSLMTFFLIIAHWTILPRNDTVDIPGEGIYIGQLKGMTFHGFGTFKSYAVVGTSYEGEWKDGMFHGTGTLSLFNGSQLVGEFHQGRLYGQGRSICPDGHEKIVDFGEREHDDDCSGCGHHH